MNDKPEQLPEDTGKRRASYRPILITLLCALLLGGGSCFGFFATLKTLQGTESPNEWCLRHDVYWMRVDFHRNILLANRCLVQKTLEVWRS